MRKSQKIYLNSIQDVDLNTKLIKELENNDIVKQYLELLNKQKELENKKIIAYKNMRLDDFSHCKHIWIITSTKTNYPSHGCIKCGLDWRVYNYSNLKEFSIEEQLMYDYLVDNLPYDGINTNIYCDLDLARAIYSRIKERNPRINDITLLKYFEIALDNIRNISVTEERKKSRIKRLSLDSNFTRWNKSDI